MRILFPVAVFFLIACSNAESHHANGLVRDENVQDSTCTSCRHQYAWLDSAAYDPQATICSRFGLPGGFERMKNDRGSFGEWLRGLPLLPEGTDVHLYNGALKYYQGAQQAVINIDVGTADLQQCADAVMRLRAEYLFATKQYDKIAFNYTSGDRLDYARWVNGRRIAVQGNKTKEVFNGKKYAVGSHDAFRAYMNDVFNYAGTLSLSREMKTIPTDSMRPGDVFIHGGTPGHAVIIVDMAVNPKTGEKLFMIAQSYMPAQQVHVLKNGNDAEISPWYKIKSGSTLDSPEYTFEWDELKRFLIFPAPL